MYWIHLIPEDCAVAATFASSPQPRAPPSARPCLWWPAAGRGGVEGGGGIGPPYPFPVAFCSWEGHPTFALFDNNVKSFNAKMQGLVCDVRCPRGRAGGGGCCVLRGAPKKPNFPFFFLLRTALLDSPQGRPTTNRHQPPPTAANRQPLFNSVSVVLCLAHVLAMKRRASP